MQKTIALVDDDEAIREKYTKLLTEAGFLVEAYADGHEAFKVIKARLPDMVLSEVGIGAEREAGYQLCAMVRRVSPGLPVVFLTAREQEADKISGLRAGADDYLTKDSSPDYIVARLDALLRRTGDREEYANVRLEGIAAVDDPFEQKSQPTAGRMRRDEQVGLSEQAESIAGKSTDGLGAGSVVRVVNDEFVLDRVLSREDASTIWFARRSGVGAIVSNDDGLVLNVLNRDLSHHPDPVSGLRRKLKKSFQLEHPNIARAIAIGRIDSACFIASEFLEGETLEKISRRFEQHGVFLDVALEIIDELAAGLAYGNARGVAHTDFKPANAVVTRRGQVKILNYGVRPAIDDSVSKGSEPTLFDADKPEFSTQAYTGCEVLEGAEPDELNDVYALGCVAYELCAGRHPFDGRSALEARGLRLKPERLSGLADHQNDALIAALQFNPRKRTATIKQFISDMEPPQQSRWMLAKAAVVGALVVGAASLLWSLDAIKMDPVDRFNILLRSWSEPADDNGVDAVPPELADLEEAYLATLPADTEPVMAKPSPGTPEDNSYSMSQPVEPIEIVEPGEPVEPTSMARPVEVRQDESEQQIAAVRGRFESTIRQPALSVDLAAQLLDDLNTLDELGAPLAGGRERVASRMAEEVRRLADFEGYREAITLAAEIRQLVDSDELASLENQLTVAYNALGQTLVDSRVNVAVNKVVELLEPPEFTSTWDAELWQRFAELQAVDQGQETTNRLASRVAGIYLREAQRLRIDEGQISLAQERLATARVYDSSLAGLQAESMALVAAAKGSAKQAKPGQADGEIQWAKQRFAAEIESNDIRMAEQILAELTAKLPADDPFITTEAPVQMASAYVNLAEYSLDQGRSVAAGALVNQALKRNPKDERALELRKKLAQDDDLVFGSSDDGWTGEDH